MKNLQRTTEKSKARSVSSVLLDFVFGEPLPQPDVIEHNDEQGWQAWLAAKQYQENMPDFEDTLPTAMS